MQLTVCMHEWTNEKEALTKGFRTDRATGEESHGLSYSSDGLALTKVA